MCMFAPKQVLLNAYYYPVSEHELWLCGFGQPQFYALTVVGVGLWFTKSGKSTNKPGTVCVCVCMYVWL